MIAGHPPAVLCETSEWIIVNKPAGWLSIPGRHDPSPPVVLDWVQKKFPSALVVHRLDLETSGVLLFARSSETHRTANHWFGERKVKKSYDLLAVGKPQTPTLRLADPIDNRVALTQVRVVEVFPHCFLGQAFPHTGRRHQIRIHLARCGHPLLGDKKYSGPTMCQIGNQSIDILRVALHASRLILPSGEAFEAPWPEDFRGWIESLRSQHN